MVVEMAGMELGKPYPQSHQASVTGPPRGARRQIGSPREPRWTLAIGNARVEDAAVLHVLFLDEHLGHEPLRAEISNSHVVTYGALEAAKAVGSLGP